MTSPISTTSFRPSPTSLLAVIGRPILLALGLSTASCASVDIGTENYAPTGWMGDGAEGTKYVKFDSASREKPHSPPTCQKWTYAGGPAGWAGVAWQFPANNWGDKPGRDLSKKNYSAVTFYARGSKGGEKIEFFVGGNTAREKSYPSSLAPQTASVDLTPEWRQYRINLTGGNLTSIACAFGWSTQGGDQPVTFYLDDIVFEEPVMKATAPSGSSLQELGFFASGWMGDGQDGTRNVKVDDAWKDNPHSAPVCQKWTYSTAGLGWTAIAWQYPAGNWGDKPGKNLAGYTKLTFWARSDTPDEAVEFFVGGNVASGKPNRTSLPKTARNFVVKRDWQQFTIDLAGQDLSSVICGFGWSSNRSLTLYLDDIVFVR